MRVKIFLLFVLLAGLVSATHVPCTVVNGVNTTGLFAVNAYSCVTVQFNATQSVTVDGAFTPLNIDKQLAYGENFTNTTTNLTVRGGSAVNLSIQLTYGGLFKTPLTTYTHSPLGLTVYAPGSGEWLLFQNFSLKAGEFNTSLHPLHTAQVWCAPAVACTNTTVTQNVTVDRPVPCLAGNYTVGANECEFFCNGSARVCGPTLKPQVVPFNGTELDLASYGVPFVVRQQSAVVPSPSVTPILTPTPSGTPVGIPATGLVTAQNSRPDDTFILLGLLLIGAGVAWYMRRPKAPPAQTQTSMPGAA